MLPPFLLFALLSPSLIPLAGCVSLTRSYPEKHFYALEITRSGAALAPVSGAVLSVRRFRAPVDYQGREFVYRRAESRYETDFYNEFLEAPSAMIAEQARRWLEAARRFEHVVDFASQIEPTHILEGSLTALYGDYRDKNAPRAVLELQLFLLENAPGRTAVVYSRTFRESRPVPDASPEALVAGWEAALAEVLAAFEKELAGTELSPKRRLSGS